NGGMQIRQAAASARQALLVKAAANLNAQPAELSVADGIVRARDGKSVSYGELIGTARFDVKLDPRATLKDPGQYKYVGQPVQRPDLPAKMTGRHTYVHDFRIPSMLHARVVRPAAIGATLAEVD